MSRLFKFAALGCALLAAPAFAAGVFGSSKPATPPAIAAKINHAVPASLLTSLAQASDSGLGLTPGANTPLYLKSVDGPRVAHGGNKVGILYVGADFCPYCAGQRWALVLALLRFGHFKGLEYMASSPTDAYANTPTFSFQNATYKSDYVEFTPVETTNREGKKLESMTQSQNAIFNKFDTPPYMPAYGGIPFVYIGGQYVVSRPMVAPSELSGMDWDQVVVSLKNQESNLFQSVMPQVNALSAAICRLDGGNPDSVCSASGVTAANATLYRMASQRGN